MKILAIIYLGIIVIRAFVKKYIISRVALERAVEQKEHRKIDMFLIIDIGITVTLTWIGITISIMLLF